MQNIIETILCSKRIIVFTGAGISKDSGIDTFRDKDGLWKDFDPMTYATVEGFKRNPKKVWEWYLARYEKIIKAKPNWAHYFVAMLENVRKNVAVVTQNIDGLHKKAGSKYVLELHGNIYKCKCNSCGKKMNTDDIIFENLPPMCSCGGFIRPDVVWFGEALPERELKESFELALKSDLAIVIGTSCLVYPAAEIPFLVKKNNGKIIEINPEVTPLTKYADFCVRECDKAFYEKLMEGLIKTD